MWRSYENVMFYGPKHVNILVRSPTKASAGFQKYTTRDEASAILIVYKRFAAERRHRTRSSLFNFLEALLGKTCSRETSILRKCVKTAKAMIKITCLSKLRQGAVRRKERDCIVTASHSSDDILEMIQVVINCMALKTVGNSNPFISKVFLSSR